MNVESFNLDHRTVSAPYVRVADRKELPGGDVLIKYDVRFTQPNVAHLDMASVHSIEHLVAEHMRNHTDRLIDFSPMGCQTGFYALTLGLETAEFSDILARTFRDVLAAKQVPAANEVQCGWGAHHTLEGAQAAIGEMLDKRDQWLQVEGPEGVASESQRELPAPTSAPAHLRNVDGVVLFAMDEEIAPALEDAPGERASIGPLVFHRLASDTGVFLAAVTGIGMTCAAQAGALAIEAFHPARLVSVGTCGGLAGTRIGDVVAGESYRYGDADATIFGYAYGQIPTLPECFPGDEALTRRARDLGIDVADMISANSFITTDAQVAEIAERFPTARTTDMESTALAQVAWSTDTAFVALRCVSDICGGGTGDEQFDDNVDRSSRSAWLAARRLLAIAAD